ncbi:MAG: VOC family protein [Acidobacteriota bacterium]|nr:VOC family protein [Acidobacteriota bacterium]
MFDHVGIAVSDVTESERFYHTVLGVLGIEPSVVTNDVVVWDDWWIGSMDDRHGLTRGLHVGFRARDRGQVDEFWWTGLDFGYREEGAPGPTQYDPTYYSAFLLDPDGNSVQAVYREREITVPTGCIDHLWIRVHDVHAAMRFYATIALQTGLRMTPHDPDRVQMSGMDYSFWLVRDERRRTENLHVAFTAGDDDTVRAFHAAALAGGYEDNGPPGERKYHPGYYAAYVRDPDGNNVELVSHNQG